MVSLSAGDLKWPFPATLSWRLKTLSSGLPEVGLGLIPGFGGTQRLAKVIGRNRAKEMIFTARMVKIEEAKKIGLVLESFSTKEELD